MRSYTVSVQRLPRVLGTDRHKNFLLLFYKDETILFNFFVGQFRFNSYLCSNKNYHVHLLNSNKNKNRTVKCCKENNKKKIRIYPKNQFLLETVVITKSNSFT